MRIGEGGINELKDNGINIEETLNNNGLTESDIKSGVKLIVNIDNDIKYRVRPFDTVSKISLEYNVSEKDILEYNNIKDIFIGQTIYIPSAVKSCDIK